MRKRFDQMPISLDVEKGSLIIKTEKEFSHIQFNTTERQILMKARDILKAAHDLLKTELEDYALDREDIAWTYMHLANILEE